jgi:hypothetical protein
VAEDAREDPFGVRAGERVLVGVADAGGLHLDQDLARARTVELDGLDRQGLAGFECDRGAHIHVSPPRD